MLVHFLKLIRIKNLIIIAATQYLMRYAVIFPILESRGYKSQFSDFNFFLLVLTTILLAAAGYAINDYFDTKTDLINRPETVVVGKHINRRHVMTLHIIFNTVAKITTVKQASKIGKVYLNELLYELNSAIGLGKKFLNIKKHQISEMQREFLKNQFDGD
ncbi:MAG: UbiA family prenyltransferase, partial [Bacteroidales bacterium]|nr:UbiA family prenyltransferase [Bacteroidales bacterium]